MYDILQLNDMIVPELLDIADQLKIPNAKKMDKQELVYKILDNQAIAGAKTGDNSDGKTRQRKRIIKATTGNTTEEAIVESNDKKPIKKVQTKKGPKESFEEEKPTHKKGRKKDDVAQPSAEEFAQEDEDAELTEVSEEAEVVSGDNENGGASDISPT